MEKQRLLRLVCDDEGVWWPDLHQRAQRRGHYLCLQPECLARLSARVARRCFPGEDRTRLLDRIRSVLQRYALASMQRLRGRALPGRDAVMEALHGPAPLLLLLACDASEGLARRVEAALRSQRERQPGSRLVRASSVRELGALFGRERLAVVGWRRDGLVDRLERVLRWQETLEEGAAIHGRDAGLARNRHR